MKSTKKKVSENKKKEALQAIEPSENSAGTADVPAVKKKTRVKAKTESPIKKAGEIKKESETIPEASETTGSTEKESIAEPPGSDLVEVDITSIVNPEEPVPDEPEKIQYAALSMEDLVAMLKELIHEKTIHEIINDVESIKINFYKKHKADIERKRKNFVEAGGELEDFMPEEDPLEKELKELLKTFKDQKAEYTKVLEEQKQKNLEEKYSIIEGIKELSNKQESINKTFQEFRDLQRKWRFIGPVPQASVKNLWDNYHHHVEAFYDYIKINQELRDLDLKKNLEAKLVLCEKAEELLLETNIMHAFKILQELHEQWREIGPVPPDMRTEIWERFKEATAKINKKHQDYFVNLKNEQKNNLEAKVMLSEKAEELCNQDITSNKDWNRLSNDMMELQKVWKTIGFAPKKDNNRIYLRFRTACDAFFNRKREFYSTIKEEQDNNLQLKTDLCVQAESLQESNEWKKTTEELIALQQRWKEIGPVPFRASEKIWKRFRTACDTFFERKSKHYAEVDDSFESNLQKKNDLIREIEEYQPTDNAEESLNKLKDFQRLWAEIGFVPLKMKEEILEKYRAAINKKFDELKIDEGQKNLLKFRTKLENMIDKPNSGQRIRQEREKYISRLKQLESDIILWENNIGFFAKSKNAEAMIKEVESKIDEAKKTIVLLRKKIGMIDEMED